MLVEITEDKLHGVCQESNIEYLIHHEGHNGRDNTDLAAIAAKSYWFDVDMPEFRPYTIQNAKLLKNGRIEILL